MAKEKKYAYRIKDLQTGLYFKKEYWKYELDRSRNAGMKEKCQYNYSVYDAQAEPNRWLLFDTFGHTYPTKRGCESAISKFNNCSIHKRDTTAGRLLNCKFNFVCVKTEIKYKDVKVKSETKNDGSGKETQPEVNVTV